MELGSYSVYHIMRFPPINRSSVYWFAYSAVVDLFRTYKYSYVTNTFTGTAERGGRGGGPFPPPTLSRWIIKNDRIKPSLLAWNSSRAILPPPPFKQTPRSLQMSKSTDLFNLLIN